MKRIVIILVFATLPASPFVAFGQTDYRTDIRKNPVQKNLRIAQQLMDLNAYDSALLYLNAVLTRQLDNKEAISMRATAYTNMKLYDKALSDYNALLSMNPENREATYSRGVIRYLLGQYENAIEDFQKAADLPSGETGTAYFKIDPADQFARGVSTMNKMEGDIWNYTGLCYMALQKYEQALESFNAGIKFYDDMDDLYINRALTYEALGKTDLAMSDYQFVISRNPANSTAEYNLMNIQGAEESGNDMLESLNSFIEDNPRNAHAYASRGLYYFDLKSYDLALQDFKKACEFFAGNADYIFNLALCYERLGDLPQAEATFLKVVALDETHSSAYFNLGNIKFKAKMYESSIALYTLAHLYDPENPAVLYNRALAHFELGMMDEACQDMQKVREMQASMADRFYLKYCEKEDQ